MDIVYLFNYCVCQFSVLLINSQSYFLLCFLTRFPGVPSEIQEEKGVKYQFQVFKRETGDEV